MLGLPARRGAARPLQPDAVLGSTTRVALILCTYLRVRSLEHEHVSAYPNRFCSCVHFLIDALLSLPRTCTCAHEPTQVVLLDISLPRFYLILIEGSLIFDRKDLTLSASYILLRGGTLQIGTEQEPFTHQVFLTLYGHPKSVEVRRWTIFVPAFGVFRLHDAWFKHAIVIFRNVFVHV